ncbi:MAG: diaminopimelate epimerase [Epsilonproteobacteria bacterium]|nr:MAG: diaminopimelate epimerase [Campylobacterota bacterium]
MTVTKYSGNGNDFVIILAQEKEDRSVLAKKLCHRQNGVGADGLVVLLPHKQYDFEWEFYNADGSVADMCGNASRCVAHFAHEKGISKNNTSEFLTGAGVIHASINGLYVVSDMISPNIIDKNINAYGENAWLIDSGVPHLVIIREEIETFNIEQARQLRQQYNCNVNICTLKNDSLYVRTYERGVENETLACGTGMVACFVRLYMTEKVSNNIKVHPKSGDELYISYEEGIYRFGGKVTKTFIAETLI